MWVKTLNITSATYKKASSAPIEIFFSNVIRINSWELWDLIGLCHGDKADAGSKTITLWSPLPSACRTLQSPASASNFPGTAAASALTRESGGRGACSTEYKCHSRIRAATNKAFQLKVSPTKSLGITCEFACWSVCVLSIIAMGVLPAALSASPWS